MNPDFVAALFISLGLAPVESSERFTVEYADWLLEITVYRDSGSVERLVLIHRGMSESFDKMEPFDPKALDIETRKEFVQELSNKGRKQGDIARILQMSESTISKILKQGKRDEKG